MLKKHNQALGYDLTEKTYSIQNIFNNYSDVIDEAWIIVNSSFDDVEGQRIHRRPNELENQSNVIKLEKVNGVFQVPQTFGNDEKKPFLGGKKNISLHDITGDKAQFKGKGPVNYPNIYQKDAEGHIIPTDKTLNKLAANNPNGQLMNNVGIKHDSNGIANRINNRREKLQKGQRGIPHSSLM